MKYSNKRFLSIIISIVVLLASVWIYSTLISDSYNSVKRKQGVIMEKEDSYANFKKLYDAYSNGQSNFQQNSARLSDAMPLDPAVPQELNQIVSLISASNLSLPPTYGNLILKSIDIKESANIPSTSKTILRNRGVLKVSLQLTGSYEAMKSYMSALESNVRLINVNTFTAREDVGNNIVYNLVFETYYQTH